MEKTAQVIANMDADVVALQEVDAGKPRTGHVHQARWLARRLGMDHLFYGVVRSGAEQYGLALLSRIAMERVKCGRLPAPRYRKPREVRGAMWVRLRLSAGAVSLINTHLGLLERERRVQIAALLGKEWLGAVPKTEPVILCGDLNAGLRSQVYRRVCAHLSDVQRSDAATGRYRATFFSFYPIRCLDYIFVSGHLSPRQVTVPITYPARSASDHLPVCAELALSASGRP